MSRRSLVTSGLIALTPASPYALASEHGRPFMLGSLYGPDSNHSTIGLVLLALCLVIGPLLGLVIAGRLWRHRRRLAAVLMVGALALLAAGLTTQQPYSAAWTLGPAVTAD